MIIVVYVFCLFIVVLEMNAVHYRLQSDIIYTFCGRISYAHTHTHIATEHQKTSTAVNSIAVFDFKVATKRNIPKLFYCHSNSLIRPFIPAQPFSNRSVIPRTHFVSFVFLLHFWSDEMEWHLDICNNFISFHFISLEYIVFVRQFRLWMYIFSRLHFYRQANTFNYCITTFSVNFPSPYQRTT